MSFVIFNEADAPFTNQAEPDSRDFRDILGAIGEMTGVVTGCDVTAQVTPDMTVAVASGEVVVGGTVVTVASGNVTISAADGTNPRTDYICVDSAGTKTAVAGTPAAYPAHPSAGGKVVLAAITVPAGDTDVDPNQITDKRTPIKPWLQRSGGTTTGNLYIGPNAPTTGALGIPNNQWFKARNNANTDDLDLFKASTGDYLRLGTRVFRDDVNSITGPTGDLNGHLALRRVINSVPGLNNVTFLGARVSGTISISDRLTLSNTYLEDNTNVANRAITAMSRSGTTITVTAAGHGFTAGERIGIYTTVHTFDQEVNGAWTVANPTTDTFDITVPSLSAGSYTSAGIATNRPMFYIYGATVKLNASRGGLTGTALYADDVAMYSGYNGSLLPYMGTEAYYLGRNSTVFSDPGEYEWTGGYSMASYVSHWGFGGGAGRIGIGGAFFEASWAEYDSGAVGLRLPKDIYIEWAADGASKINFAKYDTTNSRAEFGTSTYTLGNITNYRFGVATFVDIVGDTHNAQFRATSYADSPSQGAVFLGRRTRGSATGTITRTKSGNIMATFGGTGAYAADDTSAATVETIGRATFGISAAEDWTSTGRGANVGINVCGVGETALTNIINFGRSATNFISVNDQLNWIMGSTTGMKLGTATTQKLGFWNAAPTVKPGTTNPLTLTNYTAAARSFDRASYTLDQLADFVCQFYTLLKAPGLIV